MFSSLHTILISLLSFMVLLIFIHFKWISFNSKTKINLPPSPRKLPIFGNLHQLGLSPHRSLWTLSQRHGPLMLMHLGSMPVLVASSAKVAREIVKTHDLTFSNRPKLTIRDILLYGSNGIAFSPYGEQWRKLKSIAVVHLLSNTRVKSFGRVREEEITLMIGMIGESGGSLVDLSAMLFLLINNIVCKVAIGRTYRELKFKDLLGRFMHLIGVFSVGNYIPWLSWVDRLSGVEGRARKVAKEFDEFLEDVVEEHVNKKRGVDSGQDLVDILLDILTDDTTDFTLHRDIVKVVILDMFAAGTDTTSAAIEWAISELIKHPRVMKNLKQEVIKIAQGRSMIIEEDLEKMTYLKAIIKETLRLHPPIPMFPRESRQDVKLMGYDIPTGTQVLINAWAIGRDPTLWEESEEFRPERFLKFSTDYIGLNFELIPFGDGRRVCPGNQFAIAIIELVLANVVYKFDLALPNTTKDEDLDMSESTGFIVHKKFPLLVMATPCF